MTIRIGRRFQTQEPGGYGRGAGIQPVIGIGNPAAAAGRPAEQAASLAEKLFLDERAREVETKTRELDIELRTKNNAALNEYSAALGKNAVEGRGAAMAKIRDNSKQLREGLTDQAVREVWSHQDGALTMSGLEQVDSHYRQQNLHWQDETHEQRAEVLGQDFARSAFGQGYDPATGQLSGEAQKNRSGYREEIRLRGELRGWDDATREVELRKADTVAFGQAAESLIGQERFDEAIAVIGAHKDLVDVGVRDRLTQKAKQGQTAAREKAQLESDHTAGTRLGLLLMQPKAPPQVPQVQGPGPVVPPPPESPSARFQREEQETLQRKVSALAQIDGMFLRDEISDDQRRIARGTVNEQFSAHQQEIAVRGSQLITEAESFWRNNPTAENLPPDLDAGLEGLGLRDSAKKRITEDPSALAEAMDITDEQWRALSPEQVVVRFSGRLGNTNMGRVLNMHAKARGAETKGYNLTEEDKLRIEASARRQALVLTGKHEAENRAAIGDYTVRILDTIDGKAKETGKKPTQQDFQDVLSSMEEQTITVGGATRTFGSLKQNQIDAGYWDTSVGMRVFKKSLTPEVEHQIVEAIKAYNAKASGAPDDPHKPVTGAQIAEEFAKGRRAEILGRITSNADAREEKRKLLITLPWRLGQANVGFGGRGVSGTSRWDEIEVMSMTERDRNAWQRWNEVSDEQMRAIARMAEITAVTGGR